MKRKAREESRDLRLLRKLAHKRAGQIGAPDRPRIDLEEILGVAIEPPAADPSAPARVARRSRRDPATASPAAVNPDPPCATVGSERVGAERSPHAGGDADLPGWCHLRLLAEVQLTSAQMLAAPFVSWSRLQNQAAYCYLRAVRNAIDGSRKACRAVFPMGSHWQ